MTRSSLHGNHGSGTVEGISSMWTVSCKFTVRLATQNVSLHDSAVGGVTLGVSKVYTRMPRALSAANNDWGSAADPSWDGICCGFPPRAGALLPAAQWTTNPSPPGRTTTGAGITI